MDEITGPRVGLFPPPDVIDRGGAAIQGFLAAVGEAGIDHVCAPDHVSFGGAGFGFDGLIQAATLLALHPGLPVHTGVYLLPLRHPVPVARQLADLDRMAPGRFVFGVGVGGEDRREVAMCGVDPTTRGARMDETLSVLRRLLAGETVVERGRFFDLDHAVIAPAPATPPPIIIGGRSDAAVRRAGRLGDGWLGIWNSPRRFADATAAADEAAAAAGRTGYPARHAMQFWCGFAGSREEARGYVAPAMQAFYGLPFERFEKYTPYGTPLDVAEFLAAYVEAGCTEFNLIPRAAHDETVVAAVAEVRERLAKLAR